MTPQPITNPWQRLDSKPTMELRFIDQDGRKTLQQKFVVEHYDWGGRGGMGAWILIKVSDDWRDVPSVGAHPATNQQDQP